MEWLLLLKAVLSLALVLGLLLFTLWAIKYMQINGAKCRFIKKLNETQRLQIIEMRRIDSRNSAVLLRRDNTEHLLIIGTNNLLVESNISSPLSLESNDK